MKFDRLNIIGGNTLHGLSRDRTLGVSGNMEVRNNVIRWKLPYSITIKDAKVRLASAPTGRARRTFPSVTTNINFQIV